MLATLVHVITRAEQDGTAVQRSQPPGRWTADKELLLLIPDQQASSNIASRIGSGSRSLAKLRRYHTAASIVYFCSAKPHAQRERWGWAERVRSSKYSYTVIETKRMVASTEVKGEIGVGTKRKEEHVAIWQNEGEPGGVGWR